MCAVPGSRASHDLLLHRTPAALRHPRRYRLVGQQVHPASQIGPGVVDVVSYPVGFFNHCASSLSVSTVLRGIGSTVRIFLRPATKSTAPTAAQTTATMRNAQPKSITLPSANTSAKLNNSTVR